MPSSTQATARSVDSSLRSLKNHRPGDAPLTNASRDIHAKFSKLGYSLPIDIKTLTHRLETSDTKELTTYHIEPTDWIRHWMNECPELLGGQGDPFKNFKAFWKTYQVQHPGHEIFQRHLDQLDRVVPLLLHGDEGRAVKRTNYLVMSMESPLGSLHDPNLHCDCSKAMAHRSGIPSYGEDIGALPGDLVHLARQQVTNYKGHSYLSHWLLFGVGGWFYKKHPSIVDDLFKAIATNLQSLFEKGVSLSDGSVIYGAVVAIKGDLDFHKKSMALTRSYANVGQVSENKICHACMAGAPGCQFEDYSEIPQWQSSMFIERPWDQSQTPVLSKIPYDQSCPEQILQWDIFHVFKLGVARDIIGGVLILLLRLGFFDYVGSTVNIDDRFKRAHAMFQLWCVANGRSAGLHSFSKAYFNMKTLISAPWSSSKGSDSMLLLEWLIFTLRLNILSPHVDGHSALLKEMLQVCESGLDMKMIHSHGVWLERGCARRLYVSLMTCLRGYSLLGQRASQLRVRAFIQKPKQHALHHVALSLKNQLQQGASLICNPQVMACEMCEDYMGRISRLSRKVGFKLCDLRVCQRYFFKVTALLNRRKRFGTKIPKKKRRR